MKKMYAIAVFGVVFLLLLSMGCTSASPPVQTPTAAPTTAVVTQSPSLTAIPTAAPTGVIFPNPLALNEYATFGSADMIGKATVTGYEIKSSYDWLSPSWNSAHEKAATSNPLDVQPGYNTERPKDGNTFLFLNVRVENTGNKAVYAPSAHQFVVYIDGKMYSYSSVHSSDVIIDKKTGTQYDYQIGPGGVTGYVQPGESNKAEGYLIYEIPASFAPEKTFVISNLDNQNKAVWKLG
jgi:hypothetical protein